MRFTRLNGDFPILEVVINQPSRVNNVEYHYPDGLEVGLFKKDIYFITEKPNFSDSSLQYYKTPEEYISKKKLESRFYSDSGYLYTYGVVYFVIKDLEKNPITFKFTKNSELADILEELSFKYSFPLQSYVCLEEKEIPNLYEYKDKISTSA